jgi:hypothetical protein
LLIAALIRSSKETVEPLLRKEKAVDWSESGGNVDLDCPAPLVDVEEVKAPDLVFG